MRIWTHPFNFNLSKSIFYWSKFPMPLFNASKNAMMELLAKIVNDF